MALMAITNLTAILLLPDGADYRQRLSASAQLGIQPTLMPPLPDIHQQLAPGVG
jgi:hypothetical protein